MIVVVCRLSANLQKYYELLSSMKSFITSRYCLKNVQIRSFFWSKYGTYGLEKTPYLELFGMVRKKLKSEEYSSNGIDKHHRR